MQGRHLKKGGLGCQEEESVATRSMDISKDFA